MWWANYREPFLYFWLFSVNIAKAGEYLDTFRQIADNGTCEVRPKLMLLLLEVCNVSYKTLVHLQLTTDCCLIREIGFHRDPDVWLHDGTCLAREQVIIRSKLLAVYATHLQCSERCRVKGVVCVYNAGFNAVGGINCELTQKIGALRRVCPTTIYSSLICINLFIHHTV